MATLSSITFDFVSTQMGTFINVIDGGFFGKALLFILLAVALKAIVSVFWLATKNHHVRTGLSVISSCVWYIYFVTIGWNFFAAMCMLFAALQMFFYAMNIFGSSPRQDYSDLAGA